MKEKDWTDYLIQAQILIDKGLSDLTDVELAKKLFLINNKDKGAVLPTHTPSKHNN